MSQVLQQQLKPGHVQLLIKKENATTAENAGIKKFNLLYMENTNMFHHPKYYKELRKRNKLAESRQPVVGGQQQSDQVISKQQATASSTRAPDPGLKLQASSDSQVVNQVELSSQSQASSHKHQAPSDSSQELQASSPKQQASSSKP